MKLVNKQANCCHSKLPRSTRAMRCRRWVDRRPIRGKWDRTVAPIVGAQSAGIPSYRPPTGWHCRRWAILWVREFGRWDAQIANCASGSTAAADRSQSPGSRWTHWVPPTANWANETWLYGWKYTQRLTDQPAHQVRVVPPPWLSPNYQTSNVSTCSPSSHNTHLNYVKQPKRFNRKNFCYEQIKTFCCGLSCGTETSDRSRADPLFVSRSFECGAFSRRVYGF